MRGSSNVKKLADAEAARAEATEPDDETTEAEEAEQTPTEPEPPTEPGPDPEAVSEAEAAQVEALEKAQDRYLKAVEKIIGADAMPGLCPTCNGTALDFAGHEAAPEYRAHEKFRECEPCGGYGKVRTGSKVVGAELADCPECVGRGYLEALPPIMTTDGETVQYGTPSWMGTAANAVHS